MTLSSHNQKTSTTHMKPINDTVIGTINTFLTKSLPYVKEKIILYFLPNYTITRTANLIYTVKFPANLTLNVTKTGAKADWDFGSFKVMTLLLQISKSHYKSNLLQPLRPIIPKITGYFHLPMMQDPVLVRLWENEYSYTEV